MVPDQWVNVRFNLYEFTFITSLHFSTFPDIVVFMPWDARNKIRDTYFSPIRSVNHGNIERAFTVRP